MEIRVRPYEVTTEWDDGRTNTVIVEDIHIHTHVLEMKERATDEEAAHLSNTCFVKNITIRPLEKTLVFE